MPTIQLTKMTRELCHALFRNWENDAAVYADLSKFKPYTYCAADVDRYFDAKSEPSRVLLAIVLNDKPIGELQLKKIDWEKAECTMSIHLQNDAVKGKGYGTQAEHMALQYAFDTLHMKTVYADALVQNARSQHVLENVGFRLIREDAAFKYYCTKRKP